MCPLGDLRADPPKAEESDRQMVEILDLPTPPRRFPDPSSHLRVALRDPLDQAEHQRNCMLCHAIGKLRDGRGCYVYASRGRSQEVHSIKSHPDSGYYLQLRRQVDDPFRVRITT